MTERELAVEMAKLTANYKQVLVLMSTTNIDRVAVLQSTATRTGKTPIYDILLNNVLQLVTQKIPNALNSNKVGVFLPSYLYRMRNKEEYKPYIEPYKHKMKQTGRMLRQRKFYNECENINVKRHRETKA